MGYICWYFCIIDDNWSSDFKISKISKFLGKRLLCMVMKIEVRNKYKYKFKER